MPKQGAQAVRVGQLEGVRMAIVEVSNEGRKESVKIVNQGTVTQPMNGWVLASLRGQFFYEFPEDLILEPGMTAIVSSGQQAGDQLPRKETGTVELDWTQDQVWNNRGDFAVLFDAEGVEISRHSYWYDHVLKSDGKRKMQLVKWVDGYEITEESSDRRDRRATRSISRSNGP